MVAAIITAGVTLLVLAATQGIQLWLEARRRKEERAARLHQTRRELYATLLTLARREEVRVRQDAIREEMGGMPPPMDLHDPWAEETGMPDLQDRLTEVELIAAPETFAAAKDMVTGLRQFQWSWDGEQMEKAREARGRFVAAARAEINVDNPAASKKSRRSGAIKRGLSRQRGQRG